MKLKRNAKAARKASYEALAGTSKKAKNQKKKSYISSNKKHQHLMTMCGNVGCAKCFPILNKVMCI